jgi:hypothetical protein
MKEYLKVEEVMEHYLRVSGKTHDEFATWITEGLVNVDVSRVSVTNWANSKSVPNTDFLWVCAVAHDGMRRDWALDCLRVKLPELFDAVKITFLPTAG